MEYLIIENSKAESLNVDIRYQKHTENMFVLNRTAIANKDIEGSTMQEKAETLGAVYCADDNELLKKIKDYE